MRIFVASENYLAEHRGVLNGAQSPFFPSNQTRKNCVKKRYFGVKSDARRSFFLLASSNPYLKKRRREATGSRRESMAGCR